MKLPWTKPEEKSAPPMVALAQLPMADWGRSDPATLVRDGYPAKHCAIVSGPGRIIHAYWGRAVCETHLVPWWQRRIAAAFQFPNLVLTDCARRRDAQ